MDVPGLFKRALARCTAFFTGDDWHHVLYLLKRALKRSIFLAGVGFLTTVALGHIRPFHDGVMERMINFLCLSFVVNFVVQFFLSLFE